MRIADLVHEWPDYAATHDISHDEIRRIASRATDAADAQRIWEHEDWWCDTGSWRRQ